VAVLRLPGSIGAKAVSGAGLKPIHHGGEGAIAVLTEIMTARLITGLIEKAERDGRS
jgi:hypothetical protein